MLYTFFFFLIFGICSCNTNDPKSNVNDPKNFVIGTWIKDECRTDGSYEKPIIIIRSIGEAMYNITIFIQSASSGALEEHGIGIFRNVRGMTMIEIEHSEYEIEINPDAKKIKYVGCWYTKDK